MHEYSSVSASSYDPGALVAKLNEAAADGWDVVAIVPTGGDVSAFLRRGAGEATAESGDPTGEMELVGATVAEEVAVEEPETVGEGWAGGEVAAADAALTDAGAEATDGVDSATDVIDVVEVTEVPAARPAAGAAGEEAARPSTSRPVGPSPRTPPTTPRPRPRRSRSSPPEPRPRQPSPWRPSRHPLRRPSPPRHRPPSRHPSSRRRPAGTRTPRVATSCATGTAPSGPSTSPARGSSSRTRPSAERRRGVTASRPGQLPGR